jgi:microcystin-dependent protein
MGLEAATLIQSLDASNPLAGDRKNQGDDHLRLIKTVLKTTFPDASKPLYFPTTISINANRVVAATEDRRHFLADATGAAFTVTLPTLGVGDAGWEISVAKTNSTVNPVFVAPPSGTILSYQLGVAKVRCDVPWASYRFLWTGSSFVCFPVGLNQPGKIEFHAGGSAPLGYALAQGQSLLRADYPELFGWWATLYGAVDGTHFNAPDLRDRFPVGAGSSYALGATGGEATHVLSLAEIASHSHLNNFNSGVPSTNNATVPITTQIIAPVGGGVPMTVMILGGGTNVDMQNHVHVVNGNTDSKGSDTAHENRPPYIALFPIFRLC